MAGMSLLSLMVGLVISMFCCVAMMRLFKSASATVVSSRSNSSADAQMNAALNFLGTALEDGGYGIASPDYGSQLQVLTSAGLSGSTLSGTAAGAGTAGNAVIWAYLNGGSVNCAGVLSPSANSFGLIALGPVACANLTNWSSLAWPSTTVVGRTSSALSFTAISTPCSPFGITSNTGNFSLSVSTTNAAGLSMSVSHCLFNFH